MKKTNKRRIIIVIALVIFSSILILNMLYGFKLLEILAAIVLLEGKKENIITLSRKNLFFITKSNSSLEYLNEKMHELKYDFVSSYGRGYVFSREGEEIVLIKTCVLNRYNVYVLKSAYKDEQKII